MHCMAARSMNRRQTTRGVGRFFGASVSHFLIFIMRYREVFSGALRRRDFG